MIGWVTEQVENVPISVELDILLDLKELIKKQDLTIVGLFEDEHSPMYNEYITIGEYNEYITCQYNQNISIGQSRHRRSVLARAGTTRVGLYTPFSVEFNEILGIGGHNLWFVLWWVLCGIR